LVAPNPRRRAVARGEPLDAAEYFIIMPDAIGRGGSSKPSDGKIESYQRHRNKKVETAAVKWLTTVNASLPRTKPAVH